MGNQAIIYLWAIVVIREMEPGKISWLLEMDSFENIYMYIYLLSQRHPSMQQLKR